MRFDDRAHAGRCLAEELLERERRGALHRADCVVIALPRGGVPVGIEIARALDAPLDVCVVRKVGAPWQPELALAAVAEGGELVVNDRIAAELGLSRAEIQALAEPKRREVEERIRAFRGGREALTVAGRTAILVDDGVATGATALAAAHVLKAMKAEKVLLALPVCPPSSRARLEAAVDELLVLETPASFQAVGQWYRDFDQVEDDEVRHWLQAAAAFGRREEKR